MIPPTHDKGDMQSYRIEIQFVPDAVVLCPIRRPDDSTPSSCHKVSRRGRRSPSGHHRAGSWGRKCRGRARRCPPRIGPRKLAF